MIELIDLPPAELVRRLHEGKVYLPERATAAAQNFSAKPISRRCENSPSASSPITSAWTRAICAACKPTPGRGRRGIACSSPSGRGPFSEPLIRWTRRMADGLRCRWLAVHVENPRALSESAQSQLERISLPPANSAQKSSPPRTTISCAACYAWRANRTPRKSSSANRSLRGPFGWLTGERLLRRLARESGDIDLHAVRAEKAGGSATRRAFGDRCSLPIFINISSLLA